MHWGCHYATTLDIEVDPQRRRFGLGEADFARLGHTNFAENKPETEGG
jgi:hypothetical protein